MMNSIFRRQSFANGVLRIRLLEYVRDFIKPHGPRSAASDPGGTLPSQLLAGPSRTWTTNLLRHRDYGIGRPRVIFHRRIIGTDSRVRSSATRPARLHDPSGSGPEQRLGALEDSEADDSWRTKLSIGHVMLSCKGLCGRGLSRVWGFVRLES